MWTCYSFKVDEMNSDGTAKKRTQQVSRIVKWLVPLIFAFILVGLANLDVQAYRLWVRAFSSSSTTYERDASYNAMGAGWTSDANTAVNDWSSYFTFQHTTSNNKLSAVAMGSTAALGSTTSYGTTTDPYMTGFDMKIVTIQVQHSGLETSKTTICSVFGRM